MRFINLFCQNLVFNSKGLKLLSFSKSGTYHYAIFEFCRALNTGYCLPLEDTTSITVERLHVVEIFIRITRAAHNI